MSDAKKILIDRILEAYEGYAEECRKTRSYSVDDAVPRNLIHFYYTEMEHLDHETIADNYRKKFIQNENILENIKVPEEQEGLEAVVDYILNNEWENFKNIFVILKIHQLLYSKVPNPEAGGKFKQANNMITDSDTTTTDVNRVSTEVGNLNQTYIDLLNKKEEIENSKSYDLLFNYLHDSIKLSCDLLEIHPFFDGNGRTFRALLNILFRNIGLPPVYVTPEEKNQYHKAIDIAVREKDFSHINQFYYYKICDSIVELDLKEKEDIKAR